MIQVFFINFKIHAYHTDYSIVYNAMQPKDSENINIYFGIQPKEGEKKT